MEPTDIKLKHSRKQKTVTYADVAQRFAVEHLVNKLRKAQSGAFGIARTLSETDFSDLGNDEDPIRLSGLADGLSLITEEMFSLIEELSEHLTTDDKGSSEAETTSH